MNTDNPSSTLSEPSTSDTSRPLQNTSTPRTSPASEKGAPPAPLHLNIISRATIRPPPPSADLSVRQKTAPLLDHITNISISAPQTGMAATPNADLLHKGFGSLGNVIEEWERQSGLRMDYALIGDASGDKPLLPGHVKMIAVARVTEADLRAQEPVQAGSTFSIDHPIDGVKETLQIIGTIRKGTMELVVGEAEARKFFTKVGAVEDVSFFDCVGDEGRAAREEEKKRKKREKKARQRGGKKREKKARQRGGEKMGGKDGDGGKGLETEETVQS